jgi:phage gpG-like protein
LLTGCLGLSFGSAAFRDYKHTNKMSDFKNINRKLSKLAHYLDNGIYTIVGVEAVNHFRKSFENEGFTDTSLEKWSDVKRRDPSSPWFGYSYGSGVSVPNDHPKRKGAKSDWKQRKQNAATHYSPTAGKTKILHSQKNELKDSLKWVRMGNAVRITAAGAYAQLLNEGGPMKIFGKKATTMPKRQFMGPSKVLKEKIESEIAKDIINIFKS